MIERIQWPGARSDELSSPFLRGAHERPLRLTFHTAPFGVVPPEEAEALEALRQLSSLPEIDVLSTEVDSSPHLKIGEISVDADAIPIVVNYQDGRSVYAGISYPHQWPGIAARLVQQADPEHPDATAMLTDLLAARAHHELHRDILVTLSPRLLEHRRESVVRETNPRTPTEAAQIVGLFLRSRGNYAADDGPRFGRGLFYWVLARHRLPSMWRYVSACVAADKIRGDDILQLGGSILIRCARALEARDEIGKQFYIPQNNDTRSCLLYHFDYLTLLLSGAFDAQARVAHRAYGISNPDERRAGFRNRDFQRALGQSRAHQVHQLVTGQDFQDVMTLIFTLRNTIHGAHLDAVGFQSAPQPQVSLIELPPGDTQALWAAAQRRGSSERWGLVQDRRVLLEPYTYAAVVVAESLRLLDAVAAATDIQGLFPVSHARPPLMERPPDNEVFGERVRNRLAVLG